MPRENFNDLLAFIAVARERSFTRAAAQLGVSQSALSHTIRALETRLGLRLLTRTTRSVAPTEAGDRLLETVAPRFEEIEAELAAVTELRDMPTGTIRITATDYATKTILWPRLSKVLRRYPEIKVEIITDYGLSDIVADRYDIGVRNGDQVAKDMIAVRVGFYAWELRKEKREVQVRVEGQLAFNGTYQMLDAALSGYGLAYIPADIAQPHITAGRLVWVLEDWSPTFAGLHAYYASRRQSSRAMNIVIDALRYSP
jgi:DNA-binding transcriptional LysR family regulator